VDDQRLETRVRQKEDVCVVDVRGEIDLFTAPVFKDAVGVATERGGHVIINLTGVNYMDSSGFGTLLSATKKLRPSGGSIHLVGCNDVIQRMLQITRLNTIFGMHASEDEAFKSLPGGNGVASGSLTAVR
jgi:anti-sigma B factor antagonist